MRLCETLQKAGDCWTETDMIKVKSDWHRGIGLIKTVLRQCHLRTTRQLVCVFLAMAQLFSSLYFVRLSSVLIRAFSRGFGVISPPFRLCCHWEKRIIAIKTIETELKSLLRHFSVDCRCKLWSIWSITILICTLFIGHLVRKWVKWLNYIIMSWFVLEACFAQWRLW